MKQIQTIRNKIKREQVFHNRKQEKNKQVLKTRLERKKIEAINPKLKEKRLLENVPKTLENTRQIDETIKSVNDKEVELDLNYFKLNKQETNLKEEIPPPETKDYYIEPKILVTTSTSSTSHCIQFSKQFASIFPAAQFVKRGRQFQIKHLVQIANERGYTALVIINEDKKVPNAITIIQLPEGPSLYFTITSIVESKKIRNHGNSTPHPPELLALNFTTRLGKTVQTVFENLFGKPDTSARQTVTILNQRDFLFFRRHRYEFREDGSKCALQEIGPRFTMRLEAVMKDEWGVGGEYEWKRMMEGEHRNKFYL